MQGLLPAPDRDASAVEVSELRAAIATPNLRVATMPSEVGVPLLDLERSLVEQAILFESACFVGTRHSTFSTAVHETREAAGRWAPDATWNVLCGHDDHPTPRHGDLGPEVHRWPFIGLIEPHGPEGRTQASGPGQPGMNVGESSRETPTDR